MGIFGQIGRLAPGSEEKLDGNAYLWLTVLMGVIGWAPTAYLIHFETGPPSGVVSLQEVGPWIQTVGEYSWPLMWLWGALFVVYLAVTVLRVEPGAVYSVPNAVWAVGMAIAIAINGVGVDQQIAWAVWLPWLVLFAVGYLVTGLLVTRGWVYLLAGAVSGILSLYCVYAMTASTGALVIDPAADAPVAGVVLFPIPFVYVVIGALHVVPLAIDAAMGGRQMTDAGIPRVEAERSDDGSRAGGVVPE